ncbi:hypothetical protein ACTWPB_28030 [Nocardia sp. IBHARD005]|uniref:hypothetical protein n=1 Tax=Nocardia sp. IBHARD005 TaxID=3457765 RepID=UPI004059EBEF
MAKQLAPPVLQAGKGLAGAVVVLIVGLILHALCTVMMSATGTSMVASIFAPICMTGWLLIPATAAIIVGTIQRSQLTVDLPRRQANWQVWNTMYFCFRDDVAFVPGGPPFSPSQLPGFVATNTGPFASTVAIRDA